MTANLNGPACSRPTDDLDAVPQPATNLKPTDAAEASIVVAGGCFWCVEGVFEQLDGVGDVISGYAGGDAGSANYQAVSSGSTDHAEVVKIDYDPEKISYAQLLKVFFTVAHDPTQLNRQGPDRGRQYRSAVFYQSDEEKQVVESYIQQLNESGAFGDPIATALEPLGQFHPAEASHQDFVRLNPTHPYIVHQALPKVKKVREKFADLTK